MLKTALLLLIGAAISSAIVLVPPNRNLALGRKIHSSFTCGEVNGQPIREMYCTIAASAYTPHNQYSYSMADEDGANPYRQARMEKQSFLQGGQNCDFCEANSSYAHPASNMVDGSPSWWQSPPLSRGIQYNEVNITIDLEQEFHVAYVWIQMANSPRPGTWTLERSVDYGLTYTPWQHFAASPAECSRRFGTASLRPIEEDDSVICTHEFSQIHPMENGEIVINLLENRPGKNNFSHSPVLQNFARATNVRLRLIKTKTLQGQLMDLNENNDPTVTRRYYYAIKEIMMGGRCVCNGHADSCDVLDVNRPRTWLCRCDHNTCGDSCDKCCPGFEQKKWHRAREGHEFVCEPCNCHGHSNTCVYEEELDEKKLSLDIHGEYNGGGRCMDCRHNTQGINCNECVDGYYRPEGKSWNETDVCQRCVCDPTKHNGRCAEITGKCECLPQFTGENCDQCSPGYYDPPTCKPCQCNINGTDGEVCLAPDEQCPCKVNFAGKFCDECAAGYTNITKGCIACTCDDTGSRSNECDKITEQCECKQNFGGKLCDTCAKGYYNYPTCDFCDCDPSGTEGEVCDMKSGQCLCKAGFAGKRCDQCDVNHYGYPNCRSCNCDSAGSKNVTCDIKTGECPCHSNFTGRTCDKCAAGFYNYPKCHSCDCVLAGSKGLTCDNDGQCYCKPNFVGKHCDQCKPNFYNFPVCEECNCNPHGVAASFAGCDKVAPGELCTCKENVIGRTCNECKPTFWDLHNYHDKGCIDCACNMTGTVSLLNNCNQNSGQCACKRYVQGQKCDHCVDGFYQLEVNNHVGCQPCNCDIGGSVGHSCNMVSGQCRCRPRVEGIKCSDTIKDHYYPTLWHMKYEAEEARLPDNNQVRYAIDENQFPEFSWKGFTVFSPIQNKIYIDVDIRKSSVYKLLLHYLNPTSVPIDVDISVAPVETSSADFQQNISTTLPIAEGPATVIVNDPLKPFVLNPGRWRITFQTSKRLFLDYIVLLPAEYYDASLLAEKVYKPCTAKQNESDICVALLYPPLPTAQRIDISNSDSFKEVDKDGNVQPLTTMTVDDLPEDIGQAILVESGKSTKDITIDIPVPEDGTYFAVLEYFNPEPYNAPLKVQITQGESTAADGVIALNHCPYAGFCRELLTADGKAALLGLKKSPPNAVAHITVQPDHHFGIIAVNLIKEDNWNNDYLKQYEVCIRRNGQCEGLFYPPPPNAIVTEAESGRNANNSISGDKLPFNIDDDKNVQLMSLDNVQSTLEISGVVTVPGQYVFVIHYYNPDNTPLNLDIMVQNDRFADADFHYCPTVTGCRTVVFDKQTSNNNLFQINDKYSLTLYFNQNQKGPIYIDSVTAVPSQYFRDNIIKPLPIYKSNEFFEKCSANHFENNPTNVSEFCQRKIFALTVDFNNGAIACGCNAHGSYDFGCEDYGGQCKCKQNIIGRTCDRCSPGHYNFPNCLKCRCGINQQCDERTGQCYCPLHVEGINCDKCVSSGFGYDPLIGCQLCGCHPSGSYNGELRCDANNGQCLCKANVGGRQCDRCLPGYYGFPHCYPCQCNIEGTTEAICDETTAQCICKKNVQGATCDQCVSGTFFLRAADTDGCSDCFCFDVTDRCVSSNLPVNTVNFDDQSWKTDDPNGNVSGFRGIVTYTASSEGAPENVYFVHENGHNKDYTTSYGLSISFIIASFKSDNNSFKSNSADVKFISGNNIIEYWAAEQPHDPSQRFTVNVPLLPDVWLLPTGEPTTRAKMMMILRNLTSIAVKASYYAQPIKAIMEQFEIEVGGGNNADSPVIASSVEVCQCPPPYTGNSCQFCAPGYYRVKSDSLTGTSCVPCNCYGHTGTCDPDTGICSDCQHNTVGEHCERCMEGFYGNSTTGSPYACLACACPHATPTNNFAVSCEVSETGNLQSCNCKPGFSGDRCEVCDVGFYGSPLTYAGTCEPCFCNNNNNLTEYGSCNPASGDCALCKDNTDGRNCEYCKPWYYGDAVAAKNCTECSCNQCGSYNCDNILGKCNCQPYVEGENCDKCVENAWGFDSCQGCRMCNCGTAASNSQCDLKTGQCACMPGADGMRCESCKHGYWNYGAEGCKKCDCEADLSMGTVCDVQTGHCHCQEGATGHRCDSCLDGFLRIPTLGCRQCDECVFALSSELDGLTITADALNTTLSNVSSVALIGAKLHKINKNIDKFRPQLQLIIDHRDGNSEMHKFQSEFEKAFDDASKIHIQTSRLDEQFKNMNEILGNASNSVKRLQSDARDLYSVTNWVIHGIGLMPNEYRTRAPIQNREQLIADGERFLEKLRNNTFDSKLNEIQKVYNESAKLGEIIQSWEDKSKNQSDEVTALKEKLNDLNNITTEFERELQGIQRTATEAGRIMENLPFFQINSLINGIEKDSQAAQGFIETHESINRKLVDIENQLRDFTDTLRKDVSELNQGSENVKATMAKRRRKRRTTEKTNQQLLEELKQNEQKALALMGIYDAARLESKTFVDATHIYEDLLVSLADARNYSADAITKSHEAGNDAQGIAETSKKLSETSQQLSTNIKKILTEDVEDLTEKKEKLDERLKIILAKAETFWAFINSTGMNPEDIKKLEAAVTAIINTEDRMTNINSTTSELTPKVEEIAGKVGKLIEEGNEYQIALDKSKAQLSEAEKQIPIVAKKIEALDEKVNKNEKVLSECALKIIALKEKIALARDKTNMIKLSAHFEPSSHLELPISQQTNDVSIYTDIRFFFRTPRETGTLLYLGNEEGNNAEYINLEVDDRKPKLVINLGNGPITAVLPTEVNDNQWRELIIRRAGGHAVFEVSKPNTDEIDQRVEVSVKDTNAVLNLDPSSQRILLGGFPSDFRVPSVVSNRTFTGDVDTLRINGMLIGLWNGKKVGNVLGAPHRPPVAYETSEENAVSFDGNGYLQIGAGSYNLRKRTTVLLSFMTYSPDGLLFFVGKDNDQLVVELTGGRVSLSFDLGSGVGRVTSSNDNYNDGKWHIVHINRVERRAKLEVDGSDVAEGESPGTMFEMSVSDSIYLGGLPQGVDARFTVQPFRGCLKNLKIDADYANLAHSKAAKGIQPSCPYTHVRVASTISERASMTLGKLSAKDTFDLSVRFRTEQTSAHIVSVLSAENENLLQANLENGNIIVDVNGDDEKVEVPLSTVSNGEWHYLTITRKNDEVIVTLDDSVTKKSTISDAADYLPSDTLKLQLGKYEDGKYFVGCLADVVWNGALTNFAMYTANEVKLTECTMQSSNTNITAVIPHAEQIDKDSKVLPTEDAIQVTTSATPKSSSVPSPARKPDECALHLVPHGLREDSAGFRFGTQKGSRLEFDRASGDLDRNLIFSVQLRAIATNGFILFVSNEKQTDFITMFLNNGLINFMFGQPSYYVHLVSTTSMLDNEWHTVRVEREGSAATLYVDGNQEANNQSIGLENLEVQPPLFIGGLSQESVPIRSKIFNNRKELPIRSEFGGCLRDFKINGKKFDNPAREQGVVPCSEVKESGIFFGKEGGHAVLDPEFVFTSNYAIEMEIRPRTKNALLLSVGVLEFASVQLVDGNVVFMVDIGSGSYNVTSSFAVSNAICDGHWHHIKVTMKKNIITISVDQRSGMTFIKKNKDVIGKDKLYFGGIPRGMKLRKPIQTDPYVGCVRNVAYLPNAKNDGRIEYDMQSLATFGDVTKDHCPLN